MSFFDTLYFSSSVMLNFPNTDYFVVLRGSVPLFGDVAQLRTKLSYEASLRPVECMQDAQLCERCPLVGWHLCRMLYSTTSEGKYHGATGGALEVTAGMWRGFGALVLKHWIF